MLTLTLALLACAPPTCDEVEGAICEDELAELLADDTGVAEGWAWFDAEGRQVTIDAELLWEDDDGVIWQVDPVLAEPYPLEVDSISTIPRFESEDCSGEALVIDPPPTWWAYAESGGDLLVWTGGDAFLAQQINSYEREEVCSGGGPNRRAAAPWSTVQLVSGLPSPGWQSPLTLEVL